MKERGIFKMREGDLQDEGEESLRGIFKMKERDLEDEGEGPSR